MQLAALEHRFTPAQLARRSRRIEERRARSTAPAILNAPAMPSRVARLLRWAQSASIGTTLRAFIRRERKTNLAKGFTLAGAVEKAFARLRARRAPHCPHQYRSFGTIDRLGRRLKTDACGGKLRRASKGRLVCSSCGRGWRSIGARQLVSA